MGAKTNLGRWTDGMREMYLDMKARGFGRERAQDLVLESYQAESEHPLHKYTQTALTCFEKSPEGSERLSELEADFRESAVKRSYSHKGSRVGGMIDVATRLFDRFHALDSEDNPKISDLTAISRELREMWRAIQLEVDPLGLSDQTVKSFYAQQVEAMKSLSERGREMLNLGDKAPWLNPPTTTQ